MYWESLCFFFVCFFLCVKIYNYLCELALCSLVFILSRMSAPVLQVALLQFHDRFPRLQEGCRLFKVIYLRMNRLFRNDQ